MAISNSNSTTVSAPSGASFYLSVYFEEKGTSVSNNTSSIYAKASMQPTVSGNSFWVTGAGTLYIYWHDNKTNSDRYIAEVSFDELGYDTWTRTAEGTISVEHKDDGNLSGYAFARWTRNNTYGGYVPASGDCSTAWIALTTIARKSSPTVSPASISLPSSSTGTAITVNTNRKSTSFKHTVTLKVGNTQIAQKTNVGDSCTWTYANVSSAILATIPNASSATVSVICETFNGSISIGSNSTSFTANVDKTIAKPTFSNFTYADTNSTITNLTGDNQILVQGKSTPRVAITTANKAVATHSATMSKYTASIDTQSITIAYSSSATVTGDFGAVANAGTLALTVSAIDSRAASTAVTKNITVLPYAEPVINASATRTGGFEAETTLAISGTYSRLTVSGTDKNTINASSGIKYRYKKSSESTWGSWTNRPATVSAGNFTTTNLVLSFDNQYQWDIQIQATDKLSTTTVSITLSVGLPILFISKNKKVGINKKPTLGDLDVAGTAFAGGQQLMPSHVGQIIMSTTLDTAAKVKAIYGGTWVTWGSGKVPVGVDTSDTDFATVNKTGGSKTVTLSVEQMPAHKHTFAGFPNGNPATWADPNVRIVYQTTSNNPYPNVNGLINSTGSSQPHPNVQPYITVYYWRRSA